jgi:hypothetical protein
MLKHADPHRLTAVCTFTSSAALQYASHTHLCTITYAPSSASPLCAP